MIILRGDDDFLDGDLCCVDFPAFDVDDFDGLLGL